MSGTDRPANGPPVGPSLAGTPHHAGAAAAPDTAAAAGAADASLGRDAPPSARGREALVQWTGGLRPDEIDALRAVRELESIYPLLHALVGRSLGDFFVRAAALEALVAAGRAAFSAQDLDDTLYWLDEPARAATLRVLRHSGWLDYDAGTGTTITDAGRWAYGVLSFLHRRLRESELLPTVAGVQSALQIGIGPLRHLLSMRSRLTALREDIAAARASHSEVLLRRAASKLDETLELSTQIRAVLDQVPLDHAAARRVVREIHDLLSRLHGVSADLHAAVTEVGRQYLQLTAGLTTEQIVRALMRLSRSELAAVGREALLPVTASPPLLTTEVVGHAAEQHVLRERHEPEPVVWEEPPEAPRVSGAAGVPADVLAFIDDLVATVQVGEPVRLDRLIPRGDAAESFLRAGLLALAGNRLAGEGAVGRLGAVPVETALEGDGWPEPLDAGPLARLTPGSVHPRRQR